MTRGRRSLLALLQRMRALEVAARCRVHKSNVSRWASGSWKPSTRARFMLECHCGIPAEEWLESKRVNRHSHRAQW